MAAAENNDSWMDLQRRREEHMRYEVLQLLYRSVDGKPDLERNIDRFALDLGTWKAELFRVVEWLDSRKLIRYCGAGPVVCLTQRGVAFVEREAGRRRSIRESDV